MKTYLVTGGCGFIGSHLADALVRRGHAVRVLDDLSTGHAANLPAGVEFLRGDAADPASLRPALEGVDGCFHLAAIASVERGVTEWLATHRTNLGATVAIFDEIRRTGTRLPVIYASSAAVYGNCTALPIGETTPARPLSSYGADKLGCELHAAVATGVHGIPTVGLRFFNVYGPRQDPASPYSGVISIFCDRLRRGQAVEIFGDGGQTRDFVYVADAVAALMRAMEVLPADAPVFNVCTGRPTSVRDLAGVVAELCNAPAEIALRPARCGDIRESVGSPDLALKALGLPETVALRDGLTQVLRWLGESRT
jgi:UDP-glucose 4-epimerase